VKVDKSSRTLDFLPCRRQNWSRIVSRDRVTHQPTGKSLCTGKGDSVGMQIPAPLGNKDIHSTSDTAFQYLRFVSCPDCSMIATTQWCGRMESTEGPVEHVRITCVYRHWFLMPADTFAARQLNH
jgi:hypothetical protein